MPCEFTLDISATFRSWILELPANNCETAHTIHINKPLSGNSLHETLKINRTTMRQKPFDMVYHSGQRRFVQQQKWKCRNASLWKFSWRKKKKSSDLWMKIERDFCTTLSQCSNQSFRLTMNNCNVQINILIALLNITWMLAFSIANQNVKTQYTL